MTDWPFSYVDRVRFGDLDAMGHLNNVVFLQFFESARVAFIQQLVPERDPSDPGELGLIFAECQIAYRSPGRFDEEIRTHVRPADVRRSSFRVEFEMRSEADERTLAEGYGVLVGYDHGGERARPLDDRLRERLAALAVG